MQWKEELDQRFGLTFVVFDREYVRRMRQERGFVVNPWATHSRFIVSHHLLRDEDYASPLRDWLDGGGSGSLLILDEAHNAAPASGARYAIDSQFTKSIRELAPKFEHRLFLSATPHNGHSNSFSALLEILDPQRFCRGVPFVERLIGTIRRECLDRTLFWTAADLEMTRLDFHRYYNGHRTHAGLYRVAVADILRFEARNRLPHK